jgi:hypothetical protein
MEAPSGHLFALDSDVVVFYHDSTLFSNILKKPSNILYV